MDIDLPGIASTAHGEMFSQRQNGDVHRVVWMGVVPSAVTLPRGTVTHYKRGFPQ